MHLYVYIFFCSFHIFYTHVYIFVTIIFFSLLGLLVPLLTFLLDVTSIYFFMYTFTFFTYSFTIFTSYVYICIFLNFLIIIIVHFYVFIHFLFFICFIFFYFILFYNLCEWLCITVHEIEWFVGDYVFIFTLYFSVLVYAPAYCGRCLMRGKRCSKASAWTHGLEYTE